jgi:hypothetical protein
MFYIRYKNRLINPLPLLFVVALVVAIALLLSGCSKEEEYEDKVIFYEQDGTHYIVDLECRDNICRFTNGQPPYFLKFLTRKQCNQKKVV